MPLREFEKDKLTGVVSLNCGGTVEMLSPKRPADDDPALGEWVKARHQSGRVCIPGNGVPYQVAVITKDKIFIVGTGTTDASVAGTVTPILTRFKQEESRPEPMAPVEAII